MRRNSKRGVIAVMLFCFVLLIGVTSVRAETTGSVPVTYTKDESAVYPLNVEVIGEGEVSIGTDVLRNQNKKYSIPVDEAMTFQLKADNDRKVESAVLNEKNIMDRISENRIVVNGEEREQTLVVKFESKKTVLPQTGDTTKLGLYFALVILSLGGIAYICNKKRKTCGEQEN